MDQITIKNISRKVMQKKDGSGTWKSCSIQTDMHGTSWVSGFQNDTTNAWKIGDCLKLGADLTIETKGQYLNFSTPKVEKGGGAGNGEIVSRLTAIETAVSALRQDFNQVLTMLKQTCSNDHHPIPHPSVRDTRTDYVFYHRFGVSIMMSRNSQAVSRTSHGWPLNYSNTGVTKDTHG